MTEPGSHATSAKTRGRGRRVLMFLVWCAAVGATVIVLSLVAVIFYGRHRRDEALARIRSAGEPVLPAEIDLSAEPTGRASAWIARMEAIEMAAIAPATLAECPNAPTGEDAAYDFERDLREALADSSRAGELTACQRTFLHRTVAANRALLEHALEVELVARIDWTPLQREPDDMRDLLPTPPVGPVRSSLEILSLASWDAAVQGDADEAVRRMQIAFHTTALFQDAPTLIGYLAWVWATSQSIGDLSATLLQLPRGTDVSSLEPWLTGPPALERLRFALCSERAIGNHLFQAIRDGKHGFEDFADLPPLSRAAVRLALDHGQANYLERFERARAAIELPPREARAELQAIDEDAPASYDLITALACPRFGTLLDACASVDAKRTLMRAALLAFRDGNEAAQRWITTQIDPFSGEPFHARAESDGTLVLWSVGRDGLDDGAPSWNREDSLLPPDEVLRIRYR